MQFILAGAKVVGHQPIVKMIMPRICCLSRSLLLCGTLGLAWPAIAQIQPPIISLQPESQVVLPGTDVTLRVLATGTPPLRYLWRRNGVFLPDETNASLVLPRIQPADGGSYSVGVFNAVGAVRSEAADIVVRVVGPAPSDSFSDRLLLEDMQGIVQGDSSLASIEPGEPRFVGGGKSVWYEWIAPANGIVTFSTRGSSFDTMLGIYTGTDLSTLQLITTGNDEEAFFSSSARFNARARNRYQILVDGFGLQGAGGQFTLSWSLELTSEAAPVIVSNPISQAVLPDSEAVFEVLTESAFDSYQWFRNDVAIRGATGAVYRISSAQSADIGRYFVRVTSRDDRNTKSGFADLQLSSEPGVLVQDKIESLFFPTANASRPTAGFAAIGLGGTVLTNDFFSDGTPGPNDPFPCNEPFFGTLWLGLTATNNGVIQVDTTGSAISNRLAVYKLTGSGSDFNNPPAFVCDVTSGPAGIPCITNFSASNGTNYTVVVEGYNGSGNLKLTCRMGIAPLILVIPQCIAVAPGGMFQLNMPASSWIPVPKCQWRRNGQNITDATNTTLVINNFNSSLAGSYSVVMSNFVRMATNTVATVVEEGAFGLGYSLATNNGNVGFVIAGAAGHAFVLERAAAVNGPWTPLRTNPSPCSTLLFTNSNALLDPQRFFRAVAWP